MRVGKQVEVVLVAAKSQTMQYRQWEFRHIARPKILGVNEHQRLRDYEKVVKCWNYGFQFAVFLLDSSVLPESWHLRYPSTLPARRRLRTPRWASWSASSLRGDPARRNLARAACSRGEGHPRPHPADALRPLWESQSTPRNARYFDMIACGGVCK